MSQSGSCCIFLLGEKPSSELNLSASQRKMVLGGTAARILKL
jgi:hypothetical protein